MILLLMLPTIHVLNPLWLMSFPGVGHKIGSILFHLIKKPNQEEFGLPCDMHVFVIARAVHWVNDGDIDLDTVSESLEQWSPQSHWYKTNVVLGGLGQLLTRGNAEQAQKLVDMLLDDEITRQWIVSVCTCAYYREAAYRCVQDALEKDSSLKDCDLVNAKYSV
jgi:hypothetical protein